MIDSSLDNARDIAGTCNRTVTDVQGGDSAQVNQRCVHILSP